MTALAQLTQEERRAETSQPLHELLQKRWSPRSYDESFVIDDGSVARLLEAARWAPSASNHQPRRFIVARRGSSAFQTIIGTLAETNQLWAPRAAALIVGIAVTTDEAGQSYRFADYDLGQSIAHLSIQALALGLHVRQMGGFNAAKLAEAFNLGERLVPRSVTAVGLKGDSRTLAPQLIERELQPRARKTLDELTIQGV